MTYAHSYATPEAFGAKGDNTADDTLAVNAAIAACQGRELYFRGRYKVTSNLVNFWGCIAKGSGSIVRGSEEYFITPVSGESTVDSNTLWADGTTGDDKNDGLFSVSKFRTQTKIYKSLRSLTPEQAGGGPWRVRMSGTFAGGRKYDILPDFSHGLTFEGDPCIQNPDSSVNGSPLTNSRPVTVIDWNNGSNGDIGMWFELGARKIKIANLKFTGFKGGGNGYGALMKKGGLFEVDNCWALECDIGFAAVGNVNFHMDNTQAQNCGTGFTASYSSSGTWDHCIADGVSYTGRGFSVTRNAVTHIDYCRIMRNRRGLEVDMAARSHLLECDVQDNEVGVHAEGAGEWINGASNFNVSNTALKNRVTFESNAAGRETRQYSQSSRNEWMVSSAMDAYPAYQNPVTVTNTTSLTTVYNGSALGELPAHWFAEYGKSFRIKVYGRCTTTAPGKLRLYLIDGSTNYMGEVIVLPGATNQAFEAEFKVFAKTINSQTWRTSIIGNGLSNANASTAVVNMSLAKTFRFYCGPGAVGDTFVFDNMEVYMAG